MACFYLISQSDPKVIANNGPCYETGIVAYVVDGDTVVMDDGRIIRYLGINTPETKNPDKPIECYGPEATIRNEEMVLGKQVELICGNENIDKYGRYFYQCTTDRGRLCSCISLWG
jgi:endonuclease YncB( thermonuclease family)